MVQLQLPEVLTLEDMLLLIAMFVVGVVGLALLVDIASRGAGRERKERKRSDRQRPVGKQGEERKPGAARQQIPGVAEAVAHEVAFRVYEAVRKGVVRVKLTRDDCPGEVVIDITTGELKCLDELEGQLRGLGEEKAGPVVQLWRRGGDDG